MTQNKYKKILIINEQHHSNIGGTERYVRNLINTFSDQCDFIIYEISMFSNEYSSKKISNYEHIKQDFFSKIDIIKLKKKTNQSRFGKFYLWFKLILPLLKWSRFINKFIKKNSIDYVIDNTINIPNGLMFIPKKTQCIWIQHFDVSNYIEKNIFIKLFRKLFSFIFCVKNRFKIKNIVVFSKDDKNEFISKKLIKKTANFFDIPLCSSSKNEIQNIINDIEKIIDNRSEIAYIGRLDDRQKNISFLKKIVNASDCKNEKITIHLYGSGEDEFLINNTDGIISHGAFNPSNVNYILDKIKILLLPSKYEGFPFVIVEALSSGIPCIISNSFLSSQHLINSSRGEVIKNFNENEWLESIRKIYLSNPETYKKYAINALEFAWNNLSLDDFKKNWINLINSLNNQN